MKRTVRSSEARRSEPSAVKAASRPVRTLPQRTCVACRTARAKRELVRVVRSPAGELSVDLRGKAPGRGAYLYVIEGDVGVNGERMETGSAAQISDEERAEIAASSTSELILVDVALG